MDVQAYLSDAKATVMGEEVSPKPPKEHALMLLHRNASSTRASTADLYLPFESLGMTFTSSLTFILISHTYLPGLAHENVLAIAREVDCGNEIVRDSIVGVW